MAKTYSAKIPVDFNIIGSALLAGCLLGMPSWWHSTAYVAFCVVIVLMAVAVFYVFLFGLVLTHLRPQVLEARKARRAQIFSWRQLYLLAQVIMLAMLGWTWMAVAITAIRSEERRVGKECVRTCRSR